VSVTFRAAGTAVAGTTSCSLSQPTGTATGDVLIALIADLATSGSSAAPTGWTQVGGAASTGRCQVFTAVVGQNSLTGTSWNFTGLTSHCQGIILGFYGASTNYLIQPDVTIGARYNSSGASGCLGITPGHNNDMVLAGLVTLAHTYTWSAATVATAPTLNSVTNASASSDFNMGYAYAILATAAATGTLSATESSGSNNIGVLLSISPPIAVPTVTVQAATSVTATTLTGNGNITSIGDDINCSAYGFVYDTSSHSAPGNVAPGSSGYPNLVNTTGATQGTGAYTESFTGLTAATTYYVRAYAQNAAGYAYSSETTYVTEGAIAAVINGTSSVIVALTGSGSLAGVIEGSSTVAVALAGSGAVAATITGTSTVSAALNGSAPLAAVIMGTGTVTVSLIGVGGVTAMILGTSTVIGTLSSAGSPISASITGQASVSGTLSAVGSLSCTINGTGTVICLLAQSEGAISAIIIGRSVVTAYLQGPNPLYLQAENAIQLLYDAVQAAPVTPQNTIMLMQVQNALADVLVAYDDLLAATPFALTPATMSTSLVMRAIIAGKTAITVTTDQIALENLRLRLAGVFVVYRKLLQQNILGITENAVPPN
jgi:hypothetical protein